MENENQPNEPKGKIIKLPISRELYENKSAEYSSVERIRDKFVSRFIEIIPDLFEASDKLEDEKMVQETMKSIRQLIFYEAKKKGIAPIELAMSIDQKANINRCQNLLKARD